MGTESKQREKRTNPEPFNWRAEPIDPEVYDNSRNTRNASEWKLELIHRYGTTSIKYGSTSTTRTPGLTVTFYPNREDAFSALLPRVGICHHNYCEAVDKMFFVVVGFVARLRAGEIFE